MALSVLAIEVVIGIFLLIDFPPRPRPRDDVVDVGVERLVFETSEMELDVEVCPLEIMTLCIVFVMDSFDM